MELTTLSELKSNFEIVLDETTNKNLLIDLEISEIHNYVNNIPQVRIFQKPVKPQFVNKSPKVFRLKVEDLNRSVFNDAFNKYMLQGKYTPSKLETDSDLMFQIKEQTAKQAIEFCKYFEWLNELKSKPAKKSNQEIHFNHQEKMLALVYLGMDTKKLDNTKAGKILSAILGLGYQNTRENLGSLYVDAINNPVRNKKHFENLLKSFEKVGLKDIAEQIKSDTQNLKN